MAYDLGRDAKVAGIEFEFLNLALERFGQFAVELPIIQFSVGGFILSNQVAAWSSAWPTASCLGRHAAKVRRKQIANMSYPTYSRDT